MGIVLTAEHNSTTELVLRTLRLGKERMTAKEISAAAGVREAAVEMMLADAVEEGLLRRARHSDGNIAYTLCAATESAAPIAKPTPLARPEAPKVPAAPAAVGKRGPGRAPGQKVPALPDLDMGSLKITLRPLADGRAKPPAQTKWGPLFDKLAAVTPSGSQFPTVELDKVYGKAVQAAARKYSKDTGVKLKVSIAATCLIQRVA